MSYAISMTIQTQLRTDRPVWVTEYLQAVVSKDPTAGRGPDLAAGAPHYQWAEYLPERDWFTGVPCGLAPGLTADTERFWLASDFHDDFIQHDTFFMELIGNYTAGDSIIGSIWNDMSATKFTQYASIGGELHLLSADGGWHPANSES
ncbi:hypothetical protein [Pseudoclavibacter sp. JSM 162008]|uniref:hypothetical protein n=1 Tax=Pseudoclavibacter sp. JSM 162008 TaxID=3229855 RepID=UPI00352669F7